MFRVVVLPGRRRRHDDMAVWLILVSWCRRLRPADSKHCVSSCRRLRSADTKIRRYGKSSCHRVGDFPPPTRNIVNICVVVSATSPRRHETMHFFGSATSPRRHGDTKWQTSATIILSCSTQGRNTKLLTGAGRPHTYEYRNIRKY